MHSAADAFCFVFVLNVLFQINSDDVCTDLSTLRMNRTKYIEQTIYFLIK